MKWNMKVLTIFPWMLLKIEFCTQPRVSVHKENCLRASINSSTNTTVGLKMKRHTSKFLLLKGTKQAILFLSESQSQLPLLIFFEASVSPKWTKESKKSQWILETSMTKLFKGTVGHGDLPGLLWLLQLLRQWKRNLKK